VVVGVRGRREVGIAQPALVAARDRLGLGVREAVGGALGVFTCLRVVVYLFTVMCEPVPISREAQP